MSAIPDGDECIHVALMMEKYGGGFVKALSRALIAADNSNRTKIRDTWPNEWEKYLAMYNTLTEVQKEALR